MIPDTTHCQGCDHPLSQHFTDITGIIRCLHTKAGTSTSGIIGIPYMTQCDCANLISINTIRKRKIADDKAKTSDEWAKSIVTAAAKKLNELKALE